MTDENKTNTKTNKLINEKSPYLLEHAHNPVDWHPWSVEAFTLAKELNKPIFLSIGYASCHWCHVMAHESFEDEEVASLLNEAFVCIKVDREEMPHVDNLYMDVCQITTGRGGWPLTVFLDHDKRAFFAGTYFPKEDNYGQPGLMKLIPNVKYLWELKKDDLLKSCDEIEKSVKQLSLGGESKLSADTFFEKAFDELTQNFDAEYGGFGRKTKFPTPHHINFLLTYYKLTNTDSALAMAEKTLKGLSLGGIFDQIGYGYHRYSTDKEYILPHFEKMLFDQANISVALTNAYLVTKNNFYKDMVEKVLTYAIRDLMSSDGGFYSSEDADSEGEEGRFYTWTVTELKELLTEDEFEFLNELYSLKEEGNFFDESTKARTGRNIFYRTTEIEHFAREKNISNEQVKNKLKKIKDLLFSKREQRVKPNLDYKILTDQNCLTVSALIAAYKAFGNEVYKDIALKCLDFIQDNLFNESKELMHSFAKGEVKVIGTIDDYSTYIKALIDLYEATFEKTYLSDAVQYLDETIEDFYDNINGGFFFTKEKSDIPLRLKYTFDGAGSSGNSIMAGNLSRMFLLTGNVRYRDLNQKTVLNISLSLERAPSGHSAFLNNIYPLIISNNVITIAGNKNDPKVKDFIKEIHSRYLPTTSVILNEGDMEDLASFTKDQKTINGNPCIYLCIGNSCLEPMTDIKEVIKAMDEK